jgi:hypothetical protein
MTLITLFSAPKAFDDPRIALIQRNAIASWTRLPDAEVILLGDEAGLAQAARGLGVRHCPEVRRSAAGTPLISSMFDLTRRSSDSPLLAIVNTDIVLFPDLIDAARRVASRREHFVLMGRRWDLNVTASLDFATGWESRLRETARTSGSLHRPAGSDYFVFPRSCYTELPDFTIGRAGWDNWMIYHARRRRWPAIDATQDVMIVHQNHDYAHLPGGRPHYDHPETLENIRLAGGRAMTRFTLLDADRWLVNGEIRRWPFELIRTLRALETYPLLAWNNPRLSELVWRYTHRWRNRLSSGAESS